MPKRKSNGLQGQLFVQSGKSMLRNPVLAGLKSFQPQKIGAIEAAQLIEEVHRLENLSRINRGSDPDEVREIAIKINKIKDRLTESWFVNRPLKPTLADKGRELSGRLHCLLGSKFIDLSGPHKRAFRAFIAHVDAGRPIKSARLLRLQSLVEHLENLERGYKGKARQNKM